LFSESHFGISLANPSNKTISFLFFFSPVGGGVWGGAGQKLKGNGFGRAVALVATSARWRGGVEGVTT